MKHMNIVITILIQLDERDGEPKHDEPGHAGDDEHEQWDAGINLFFAQAKTFKVEAIILRSNACKQKGILLKGPHVS